MEVGGSWVEIHVMGLLLLSQVPAVQWNVVEEDVLNIPLFKSSFEGRFQNGMKSLDSIILQNIPRDQTDFTLKTPAERWCFLAKPQTQSWHLCRHSLRRLAMRGNDDMQRNPFKAVIFLNPL